MDLENLVEKNFSGCISVVKDGSVIFEKNYGYADLPNKISNELYTKFATASAGKVFVAVGILQLIERGKLKLEDTIGNLLDFDLKAIDGEITVKQLLCHTSGIPDYFDESTMSEYAELWKNYPNYKIRESSDLIPLFIDKPMMYPAGERFQYNNTGFVVLGLIIEKLTGQLFDKFLQKNVFESCCMFDTGYYEMDRLPANCANSYIYDEKSKEYYTNIYSVDVKGTGAGGAFTTITDINKFWANLMDGKLVSSDMLGQMLSVHGQDESEHYGYGIWLHKTKENTYSPYFQGCDPGVSFISVYHPASKITITAMSNFGCNVWKLVSDLSTAINELK